MEKMACVNTVGNGPMDSHAWFQEDLAGLGGKWRCLPLNQEVEAPADWQLPDFDDRKWERIIIAGELEDVAPDVRISGGSSGVLLRRSFRMARDHGSKRVIFLLRCPVGFAELWINGKAVGSGWGGGAALEFDVTNAIQPEKNQVCMRLTPVEGSEPILPEEVGLYTLPGRFISDIRAEMTGEWISLEIRAAYAEGFTARIALMEDNRVVCHREVQIQEGIATVQLSCEGIRLWTAADPVLYRIAVILWDGIANYHTRELTTGFRQVSLAEQGLQINGKQERILSTVYTFRDSDQSVLSWQQVKRDLKTIRDHNFNAITLTEAAPEFVYDLCDQVGLYVLDCSGVTGKAVPEAVTQDLNQRLRVVRNRHPSVIGCDLGRVSLCQTAAAAAELIESSECLIAQMGAYRDMLTPKGSPDCAMREMKAVLAPVRCKLDDAVLTIENRSFSRSTSELTGRVILTRDGELVWDRALDVQIPPRGTVSVPMETRYDVYKPGRYHLAAEFVRSDGTLVARDQWEVGNLRHIYDENPGGTIREESGRILLRSQNATYAIGRDTGCPEQLGVEELTLLSGAMLPVFSRVGSVFRLPNAWDRFSLRWIKNKPSVLEVDQMTRTVTASFRLASGLMQTYRLFADGSMAVELRLRTGKTAPERIGWQCILDSRITNCRWFGLGPDPSIPDQRLGRYHGIHTLSEADGGYRSETGWLELTDNTGKGFRIRCDDGMAFQMAPGKNGTVLTLEQGLWSLRDPHTTYTFSITVVPIP